MSMMTKVLELGRAIKQLQNWNHRRLEVGLREVDTTLAQWDALRAIEFNPGASAHALAEETFQTDQSFGTLATRLIARGYIERRQGVGRALIHCLTPKGQEVLKQGFIVANRVIADAFSNLSDQEQTQLLELVNKTLPNSAV